MSLYNPSYIAGLTLYLSDPTLNSSIPAYVLTDHNRDPIQISYDTQELSARMAQGQMRRFITSNKRKITTDWKNIPSAGGINFTADGNLGGAFMKSFYEQNVYYPIWVKTIYSTENWYAANNLNYSAQTNSNLYANYNPSTIGVTTNPTFNASNKNSQSQPVPSYKISGAALSPIGIGSGYGNGTITFTTSVPHSYSAGQLIYVNGIDQIFNGDWQIVSTSTNTFTVNVYNNADFNINSYSLNGTVATFSVDNNDFVSVGDLYQINGTKNIIGSNSNINGLWYANSTLGSTIFTAYQVSAPNYTANGYSDISQGFVGSGVIFYKNNTFTKNINSTVPSVVTAAGFSEVFKTYITNFTYNINKRFTLTDFVDVNIEFTEI